MLNYREIQASDDKIIAGIVRENLEKFHLDIPGTVYFDPELDRLSEFYNSSPGNRVYYTALDENGKIIGGVCRHSGLRGTAEAVSY